MGNGFGGGVFLTSVLQEVVVNIPIKAKSNVIVCFMIYVLSICG
jgi:hypothetical protein